MPWTKITSSNLEKGQNRRVTIHVTFQVIFLLYTQLGSERDTAKEISGITCLTNDPSKFKHHMIPDTMKYEVPDIIYDTVFLKRTLLEPIKFPDLT